MSATKIIIYKKEGRLGALQYQKAEQRPVRKAERSIYKLLCRKRSRSVLPYHELALMLKSMHGSYLDAAARAAAVAPGAAPGGLGGSR